MTLDTVLGSRALRLGTLALFVLGAAPPVDEAAVQRLALAERIASRDLHPTFRKPTEGQALDQVVRALSPQARTAFVRLLDAGVTPSVPEVAPAARSAPETATAPLPPCTKEPQEGPPLRCAEAVLVWDQDREEVVDEATQRARQGEVEQAAHQAALLVADAVPDDVMDAIWSLPVPPEFITFGTNDHTLDGRRTTQVDIFAQRVGHRVRLGQGDIYVVTWSSPTNQLETGAHGFAAIQRAEAVSVALAARGLPVRRRVTVEPVARFHVRFGLTPNYYRVANPQRYVTDRANLAIPDFLEQQSALLFYADHRLGALLRGERLDLGDDRPQREAVSAAEELRRSGGPDLEAEAVTAHRARRDVEQLAVEVCNSASEQNLRLVADVPGVQFGSLVSLDRLRPIARPHEAWPAEQLEAALGPGQLASLTIYDADQAEMVVPWVLAVLSRSGDRVPTLAPRPRPLLSLRPPSAGVRLELAVTEQYAYVRQFRVDAAEPLADPALRELGRALLAEDVETLRTPLGSLEHRLSRPAAVTARSSVRALRSGPSGPGAPDAALAAAVRDAVSRARELQFVRTSPLAIRADPLTTRLGVEAVDFDLDEWSDTAATEEMFEAERLVDEGVFTTFAEALQAVHPRSAYGTCVSQALHGPAAP